MLPRNARLTSANDFARTTKSGFRASSKYFVAYLYPTAGNGSARCGLIISKSVGGSVFRHKIARKIRHALFEFLPTLPDGTLVVIRALPGSTDADPRQELRSLIPKVIAKALVTK